MIISGYSNHPRALHENSSSLPCAIFNLWFTFSSLYVGLRWWYFRVIIYEYDGWFLLFLFFAYFLLIYLFHFNFSTNTAVLHCSVILFILVDFLQLLLFVLFSTCYNCNFHILFSFCRERVLFGITTEVLDLKA